jgi:hypothetical protein
MTILAFQNCAPTKFTEAKDVSGLSLSTSGSQDITMDENGSESMPSQSEMVPDFTQPQPLSPLVQNEGPQKQPEIGETGKDPFVVVPEDEQIKPPTSEVPAVADSGEDKEVKDVAEEPKQPEGQDVAQDDSQEETADDNLVECDMGRANSKIILGGNLNLSPSNASSSRVCMSENACLKIINDFAAKRDCNLSKPISAGSSDHQCTQVFPGSRGTCKNAAKISDAEVAEILKNMQQ